LVTGIVDEHVRQHALTVEPREQRLDGVDGGDVRRVREHLRRRGTVYLLEDLRTRGVELSLRACCDDDRGRARESEGERNSLGAPESAPHVCVLGRAHLANTTPASSNENALALNRSLESAPWIDLAT
jgi:hypothetical protein